MSDHTTRRSLLRSAVATGAVAAAAPGLAGAASAEPGTLSRIALGSCAKEDRPQPIWEAIVRQDPELFLFLGDNIYADTEDMDVMRRKYGELAAKPGFKKLRERCRVLSIWDDHDFGENDAGRNYPKRQAAQELFLDFFGVPRDSPRRGRPGIYGSHVFGPKGKRVQVILLDTRYFRDPLSRRSRAERIATGLGPYKPHEDESKTILGEAQWRWLKRQLEEPAEVRIVASSIQVVSGEHGWETWGNFPHERRRLFDLIAETGAGGVVFLSGDRHMAALSRYDDGPYPLYDLTSSGLNQAGGGEPDEPNAHRVVPLYQGENFGTITIDWEPEDPVIHLAAHQIDGEARFRIAVPLSRLQPKG